MAQVLLLLAMVGTVTTRTWQDHTWFGAALALATVAVWAPEMRWRRARIWWFAYVAGTFIYTLLRALADETGIPVRTAYVIDFERVLFLGSDPVVSLQRRFFEPPSLDVVDWLAVLTHWSFFIAPHALGVAVFIYRRDLFPRYAVMVLATLYLALLLFFAIPTAPPWLAGATGDLPADGTFRIMQFAGRSIDPATYDSLYESLGEPNSVAAMPSLHLGLTFAMFLWARAHHPRLALPMLGYVIIMGLALVYLAEHYVLDLVVGGACALGGHVFAERFAHRWGRQLAPLSSAPPASEPSVP
ncbi:MAG TPA: phosphatase PAP2 family protein [Tepidiformaceae bacterium]|nr:phosphatase PAP2 family protein [Tepidiformaceae bacterium]